MGDAAASGGGDRRPGTGRPLVVDADAHIDVAPADLAPFIEEPWTQYLRPGRPGALFLRDVGDPTVAGRIRRPAGAYDEVVAADWRIVFPTQLITAGLHPARPFAAALARAYARWATEVHLPGHPRDRAMLCLPIDDVDACRAIVAEFGGRAGVVGCFTSHVGFPRMVENRYAELYADLEERGLVLGLHPHPAWRDPPYPILDRYLPVWALSYPFAQSALLVNWLIHGMPERFPGLRCAFYEAGVAWLTFVAHRFDQEFLRRRMEAPLLRERPSHYMRRYFYGTQPLDQVGDAGLLEPPLRLVGIQGWLFASAYPQWDFDRPGVVERLSFLSEDERRGVLGGNAAQLFGLPGEVPGGGRRRQGGNGRMSEVVPVEAGPGGEYCLGAADAVPEGEVRLFGLGGVEVGVLRLHGLLRAFENRCPHQGGPVCLGDLLGRQEAVVDERRRVVGERFSREDFDLICPWHGYSFDALSGECVVDRRLRLRPWRVGEREGRVYVSPTF